MRKILAVLIFVLFIATGCATDHITGRTTEGMLIGGGAGYLLCGPKCAYAGAAILGGIGHTIGTQEEMKGKTLRPIKKVVVKGKAAEKKLGVAEGESCYTFPTIEAQTDCFKEKARALEELARAERKYAREKARRGY